MSSFTVKCIFNDGSGDYELPHVQTIKDNKEGMKATVLEGTRANGSIVIPGGKKSQTISISGILFDTDGYEDLTTLINALKAAITTSPATLTLKHYDSDHSGGGAYVNDWQYSVVRIDEIEIDDQSKFRTESVNYTVAFLVTGY
jgi:hypothetical protein